MSVTLFTARSVVRMGKAFSAIVRVRVIVPVLYGCQTWSTALWEAEG